MDRRPVPAPSYRELADGEGAGVDEGTGVGGGGGVGCGGKSRWICGIAHAV